jgi:hypothetical protein
MKKLFLLAILFIAVKFSMAQPPAGPVNAGDTYGEKIKPDGAIAVDALPKILEGDKTLDTKITGKVTDVCPKKGCWLTLETADKTKVFVKMKDYGFFVPTDMIGKTIVLDGQAKLKTTTVEELQHYAEDAKKSKEEIDAITKPETEIRFTAKGILVVN